MQTTPQGYLLGTFSFNLPQLFNSSLAARLQERWAPFNSTKGWRSFSSHSTNSGPSLTLMQVRTWQLVMHVSGLYLDLIPTNTQTPHKKFLALGPWWIVSVESYAFSVFTGKRGCLLINRENQLNFIIISLADKSVCNMVVHYFAIYYHLVTNDSEILLISCDEYTPKRLQALEDVMKSRNLGNENWKPQKDWCMCKRLSSQWQITSFTFPVHITELLFHAWLTAENKGLSKLSYQEYMFN